MDARPAYLSCSAGAARLCAPVSPVKPYRRQTPGSASLLPCRPAAGLGISIIRVRKLICLLQTDACCRGCRTRRFLERHGRFRAGFAEPPFPRPSNHMLGSVGEPQVTDPEERARQKFAPKGWQLSGARVQLEQAAEGGRTGCGSPGNHATAGRLPNRLLPIKALRHWIEAADELIVPFP